MLKLRWLISIVLLLVLLGIATPVLADAPGDQQNPQTAQETFSGIALLNYYSSSLDYIIQLDQTGSDANLAKMPFANVPQDLDTATSGFADNGTTFTASIVNLFALWNQQNTYIQQSRLTDAATLYTQITSRLPVAQQQLSAIEASVADTGTYLNIASLSVTDGLTVAYNEVMAKLQNLSSMLALLGRPMIPTQLSGSLTPGNTGMTAAQIADLTAAQQAALLASLLTPTALTLAVTPTTAYVGDSVNFTGNLSSQGQTLSGRTITLLLNNADLLTLRTDANGQFQGKFQLPYLYISPMPVQAVYYPQGNDAGVYLAATSPITNLTVLFYTAKLTLQQNNTAYPGKESTVTGIFDYGNAPVPTQRPVQFYLDNALVEQFSAGPVFNQGMMLAATIMPGPHVVTISVPADGRYAPVMATYALNVTLAPTVLDLHMAAIGLIPGSIGLSGKLYSVVGPLANAAVTITNGTARKQIITAADGSFTTKIGLGMGLSLLGTQGITLQIQPHEAWNAPLTSTKNIFLINYVTLILILAVLVALAVYLPRRFKKWFAVQPAKNVKIPGMILPVPPPLSQSKTVISPKTQESAKPPEETANSVSYWYHIALKLVQSITKMMLKPHQTLREYGTETSAAMGPAGKYFMELTYLLEKRLYGNRKSDTGDIQKSKDLTLEIQKETGREP
jgi:hypothetical protein